MRIAVVAEPFVPVPPKKYGGIERVIYYLVKGLKEAGHQVTLLAPGDSEVDCELIPICPKHIMFGKTDAEQSIVQRLNFKIRKKTLDILGKIKPRIDVIHSHGMDLSSITDFPTLTTLHGMCTMTQVEYYRNRRRLNYNSISYAQRSSYPKMHFMGNVYNGLDTDEFPFVKKPKNYLVFVGRFDREKNPLDAILLAKALNMKIKLAGKLDFQGRRYFEEVIKPYFKDPLVEYYGEVAMKEKTELIANAKANLHPINFREPFGLTVAEAAYCGTPTLAVDRGSMAEIIENGRTGILVEDFVEGFQKIDKIFNMDREYISLRARELFNYRKMSEGYVRLYKKVIRKFNAKQRVSGNIKYKNVKNLKEYDDGFLSPIEAFWKINFN